MIFNLYYPFTPPAEQNGDAERASPNTPLGCAFGRAVRDVPGCQTLASGPRREPARCGRGPARLLRGCRRRSRSGVRPGPRSPEGPPGAAVTTRRAPAPPPQRGRSGPGGGLGAPRPLRARGSCGKHRAGAAGVHGVCCRLFYKASRRCSATERSRKRENVFV